MEGEDRRRGFPGRRRPPLPPYGDDYDDFDPYAPRRPPRRDGRLDPYDRYAYERWVSTQGSPLQGGASGVSFFGCIIRSSQICVQFSY